MHHLKHAFLACRRLPRVLAYLGDTEANAEQTKLTYVGNRAMQGRACLLSQFPRAIQKPQFPYPVVTKQAFS
jgi:hypothetical protein